MLVISNRPRATPSADDYLTSYSLNQNYNKILEFDWLSAGPIRALIGQFTQHADTTTCNRPRPLEAFEREGPSSLER